MKIASFGSCLSSMVVSRMINRFGGERLAHISRYRSDQYYFYHIVKDRDIIPRCFIDEKLCVIEQGVTDTNYIPPTVMLDDQYSLFDSNNCDGADILVLDNYIDLGGILSYPKKDGYMNSPIFLRKNDYKNYEEYFSFGEKLSNIDSAKYFKEIIRHFKSINPSVIIYFLHYPYNTYVNNSSRQDRAKEFESLFDDNDAVIVPSAIIKQNFQIKNDPAHFDDSVYVAYSGFIYLDSRIKRKYQCEQLALEFESKGRVFESKSDYVNISGSNFIATDSWTALIEIYEYDNNEMFNFFLGEKNTTCKSILRRKNRLEFRADDGSYIGGVEFATGQVNKVAVIYENGDFIFYNNGIVSGTVTHMTTANFNVIGGGYDGKSNEQKSIISKCAICCSALTLLEVNDYFCKNELNRKNQSWCMTN